MEATSLDHEIGWKYTLIKLKFRPSFGLTDDGPQEGEAVTAWEAVMHDIYFLGGGDTSDDRPSDTYWGRITGTENEVMITTGLRGTTGHVHHRPPLLPSNTTETTPNILSPLNPFLLQMPIIINTQWNVPPPSMQQEWMYCDLNLFHIPNIDAQLKNRAAVSLDNCIVGWYDHDQLATALKSTHRGNLYVPEGRSRSFITEDSTEWLRNSETFVHLSQWKSRESAESYKDPTRENKREPGWSIENSDWYQNVLGRSFDYVVEELGVRREEIQVEFKRWVELFSEEEREEYMMCYPGSYRGSMPTHGVHGKDCEKCSPLLE